MRAGWYTTSFGALAVLERQHTHAWSGEVSCFLCVTFLGGWSWEAVQVRHSDRETTTDDARHAILMAMQRESSCFGVHLRKSQHGAKK